MKGLAFKNQQSGSVLLTVLFVVLILLLSGLTVTELGLIREIQVGNDQRTNQLYYVTKSELDSQVIRLKSQPDLFEKARSSNYPLTVIGHPGVCTTAGSLCKSVVLKYVGNQAPPVGYSLEQFTGMVYELDVDISQQGSHANSYQTQGIVVITEKNGS